MSKLSVGFQPVNNVVKFARDNDNLNPQPELANNAVAPLKPNERIGLGTDQLNRGVQAIRLGSSLVTDGAIKTGRGLNNIGQGVFGILTTPQRPQLPPEDGQNRGLGLFGDALALSNTIIPGLS